MKERPIIFSGPMVRAIKETILRRSIAVDSAYRAYMKAAADVAEASK